MKEIRWTDLGRKYIIKKGKKSMLADIDQSIVDNGLFHTIDDRYINSNIKMHLDLNEKRLGQSLSMSKLPKRQSSVDHQKITIETKDGRKVNKRLASSNESSADQVKSQMIVY